MSMEEMEFVEELQTWLRDYYHQDILELAQHYPNERTHLEIDWGDIYAFDPDTADDYLRAPEEIEGYIKDALARYDQPLPVDLGNAEIRVTGLNEEDVYKPIQLTRDAPDGYIGVSGEIAKVTTPDKEVQTAAYTCQEPNCGYTVELEQFGEDIQDPPHECPGCGAKGRMLFDGDASTWEDYCKVRIQNPSGRKRRNPERIHRRCGSWRSCLEWPRKGWLSRSLWRYGNGVRPNRNGPKGRWT